ncbi:ATP-binding protein [Sulfuricurvum sp.]|uniref:ATP-binding protein n=1 Tax=Sulfuricurvum sp. TaxID=2025608 RepID=UPI00260CD21F|nr:ATP-binding protein [Sulfuricurvum sp.]MDD2781241.1 ATP-binding protein [Sulfuricurvum sp.]
MNQFTEFTSKSHLFNLIDHTYHRLSFVDSNYIYRAVNKIYTTMFNRAYNEIIGHHVAEILGTNVFHNIVKPYLDRALAGEEICYESWFDFVEAKRSYLLVRYQPIYEDSKVIGVVVSSTDITERKELEEEKALQNKLLIEQSRMVQMGEMVAFVAHQWRRPLHTLSTYQLRMRCRLEEVSCSCIDDELQRSEELLEHLSQSLESLYHFHSDYGGEILVKISVEEVGHLLEPHLNAANIKLEIDLSDALRIHTEIPSSRMLHLFLVFIENAIEALEKSDKNDKRIRVSGWENSKTVTVNIHDNGDGMTLEQSMMIFDAGVSTKGDNGHGYGLYFARKILSEQLGGSVELIRNEEGVCFRLTFPKRLA